MLYSYAEQGITQKKTVSCPC